MAGHPGRQLNGSAPRVGLVLAGGGVAGYAFHSGVLAAIERHTGWDPRSAELIVGTSSGSIVAAGLRADLSTFELRRRALRSGLEPDEPYPLDQLAGSSGFRLPDVLGGPSALAMVGRELRRGHRLRPSHLLSGLLPEGRVPTEPLRQVIAPLHADGWPERPLWITATDQQSGERRVFGRAGDTLVDVASAVQASCAVPGYFAPVEIEDRAYVDGGVHSPDNLDLLIGQDLDLALISSPLSIDSLDLARSPVLSVLRTYPRRQLGANRARLQRLGTPSLVVEPDRAMATTIGLNAMSPSRLRPVVEAAEALVERWLEALVGEERALLDCASRLG